MAKIEKVLPSVFGEPRAAHLTTRHPGMPNIYANMERDVKSFGADMRGIFHGLARLGEEGQNLALEQARADYEKEVSTRFNEEIFSLGGVAAADAGKKAEEILRTAESRQLEKLSAYGMRPGREFQVFATRSGASSLSRAVSYGRGEVKKATIEAGNQVMANSAAAYAATGNPSSLDEITAAHGRTWIAANGRLIDAEKLAAFDENLASGFVVLGREKLRVVDEIAPGDKGVIARATAQDLRARMVQENAMYEQSRQNQIDLAHAARIDQLLKWNMLSDAEAHLAADADRAPGLQMSPVVRDRLAALLKVHREEQTAQTGARVLLQQVIAESAADPRSLGGQYWTAEMEKRAAEMMQQLNREAADDERGIAARRLSLFKSFLQTEKDARTVRLKADIDTQEKQFLREGLFDPDNLSGLAARLNAMPDSPLKDHFLGVYARNKSTVDDRVSKNPEVKRMRKSHVQEFKRRWATQTPFQIGSQTYDLSTQQGRAVAMAAVGFAPEEQAEIEAYIANPRLPYGAAAQIVADALNQASGFTTDPENGKLYFTAQSVLLVCPEIMDELERAAKAFPDLKLTDKAGQEWLRQQTLRYLQAMQATEPGRLWGTNVVKLHEYLAKAVNEEGNVVDEGITFGHFLDIGRTPEQMRREAKYWEELRSSALQIAAEPVNTSVGDALAAARGLAPGKSGNKPVYRPQATQRAIDEKDRKRQAELDRAEERLIRRVNLSLQTGAGL